MAYVVTEKCIMCKHTSCVSVCPVDCFYEGPNFLVINPDECIDCGLCAPECPVSAIESDHALSEEQRRQYLPLNRELAQAWPNIGEIKPPLPDAEKWANVESKLHLLQR
jgi:ferredoxin